MRSVSTRVRGALLAMAGLAAAAGVAGAYEFSGAGARLGYTSPEGSSGAMTLGGHLEFQRSGSPWRLQPNLLYWKSDDMRDLSASADALYHFPASRSVTPYLGGGLGLHGIDDGRRSETTLGANVVGGFRVPTRAANLFFVESRFTITDVAQFGLLGGITFHVR
jgi:hypothetical protein